MLATGQVAIETRPGSLGHTVLTGGLCTPRSLDTSCMRFPASIVRIRPRSTAAAAEDRYYRNTFIVEVAFAAPACEFTSVQAFYNRFVQRAAHSQSSMLTPFSLLCAVVLRHCCEQASEERPSEHEHTVRFLLLGPPTYRCEFEGQNLPANKTTDKMTAPTTRSRAGAGARSTKPRTAEDYTPSGPKGLDNNRQANCS